MSQLSMGCDGSNGLTDAKLLKAEEKWSTRYEAHVFTPLRLSRRLCPCLLAAPSFSQPSHATSVVFGFASLARNACFNHKIANIFSLCSFGFSVRYLDINIAFVKILAQEDRKKNGPGLNQPNNDDEGFERRFVVPKRAALILDRILKEIESAKESNQLINDWSPISRRGNNKDKLYFRCYFNAVSCYKRK
ncbi:hypothetical protein RUM44_002647 [Polyplax serrata]|uniref:Uncharacterized protein n=1 Tax=Polyplax serrata TaxID=468196 RepID=A0ABR1AFV7_POLSC